MCSGADLIHQQRCDGPAERRASLIVRLAARHRRRKARREPAIFPCSIHLRRDIGLPALGPDGHRL
jgi:hypothetical protein